MELSWISMRPTLASSHARCNAILCEAQQQGAAHCQLESHHPLQYAKGTCHPVFRRCAHSEGAFESNLTRALRRLKIVGPHSTELGQVGAPGASIQHRVGGPVHNENEKTHGKTEDLLGRTDSRTAQGKGEAYQSTQKGGRSGDSRRASHTRRAARTESDGASQGVCLKSSPNTRFHTPAVDALVVQEWLTRS